MKKILRLFLKLRFESLASEISKLVWTALCMIVFLGVLLYMGALQMVVSDAQEKPSWSLAITGISNERNASLVDNALSTLGAHTLYTAQGQFKRITSSSIDIDFCSQSNPATAKPTITSYQLMSEGTTEGLTGSSFPWFSEHTLITGNLSAPDPVVVDAQTAQDFQLRVGSSFAAEVDVLLPSGGRKTVHEDLVVTAIVRPTIRFQGICAFLPEVENILHQTRGIRGHDAFIYNLDESTAAATASALNEQFSTNGNSIGLTSLPSYDFANIRGQIATYSPDKAAYNWLIAAGAALLMLLIFSFDARNIMTKGTATLKELEFTTRDLVFSIIVESLVVFLPIILISYAAACAFLLSNNDYFPWILSHVLEVPIPLIALLVLLAISIQIIVSLRFWKRATSR